MNIITVAIVIAVVGLVVFAMLDSLSPSGEDSVPTAPPPTETASAADSDRNSHRWELSREHEARRSNAAVYFDSKEVSFHPNDFPTLGNRKDAAPLQFMPSRPGDGELGRPAMDATEAGQTFAELNCSEPSAVPVTPGTWEGHIEDAQTDSHSSGRQMNDVNWPSVVTDLDASLLIGWDDAGDRTAVLSANAASVHLLASVNPGKAVPQGGYDGLDVIVTAVHEETGCEFSVITGALSFGNGPYLNHFEYPLTALGPGHWRFDLCVQNVQLATADLDLLTPEEVAALVQLGGIRFKVLGHRGRRKFLRGARIAPSEHRSVQPVISLEAPCPAPDCELDIQLIVCIDGTPTWSWERPVSVTNTSVQVACGDVATPPDLPEGTHVVYSFAVFVQGRYVGSEQLAFAQEPVSVADAEGRLTVPIEPGIIDFAAEAQRIRQELGVA